MMKKVFLTLLTLTAFAFFTAATAQIKSPAASPGCKLTQTAGLTEITIEYSRPSVKGRTIFGGLVPYGETWRTGANRNTVVTFSENVKVGGKELKKGSYALYTVPGEKEWDIIFYTDTNNGGLPATWDASKEAVRFKAPAHSLPLKIESFTIGVGDLTNESCSINIYWESTHVGFPVGLNTDELVSADIKRVMAGPGDNDYYAAGSYYHDSGKDLKQAYEWVHKSNETSPRFWTLRKESLILADLGKYADAIAVAEKSKALAIEAKNKDYERMNDESIAMWKDKVPAPPAAKPAKPTKTGVKSDSKSEKQ